MQNEQDEGLFQEPHDGGGQAAVTPSAPPPGPSTPIDDAIEWQRPRLLTIDGVIGVARGQSSTGGDAVLVHVLDDSVRARVPEEVEGLPVEVVVIRGGFDAFQAR